MTCPDHLHPWTYSVEIIRDRLNYPTRIFHWRVCQECGEINIQREKYHLKNGEWVYHLKNGEWVKWSDEGT